MPGQKNPAHSATSGAYGLRVLLVYEITEIKSFWSRIGQSHSRLD